MPGSAALRRAPPTTMLSVLNFLRSFFKVRVGVPGPAVGAGTAAGAHGAARTGCCTSGGWGASRAVPADPNFPTC